MKEVYEAIKSGSRTHLDIAQKTGLAKKEIQIATAKLEQQGYIIQVWQGQFAKASKKWQE